VQIDINTFKCDHKFTKIKGDKTIPFSEHIADTDWGSPEDDGEEEPAKAINQMRN